MTNMAFRVRQQIAASKVVRVNAKHAFADVFYSGTTSSMALSDSPFAKMIDDAQEKLVMRIGTILRKEEKIHDMDLPYRAVFKISVGPIDRDIYLEATVTYKVPPKKAKKS